MMNRHRKSNSYLNWLTMLSIIAGIALLVLMESAKAGG